MLARRFLPLILMVSAAPVIAQESPTANWSLSLNVGPGLGGPLGQLRDRLVDEHWTDQYCDTHRSDCHTSPTASHVYIQVGIALGRRISDKLELQSVVEVGDLGQIIGAKGQYEIKADWKTLTLGTALLVHPIPHVRIGGGPLIGMLTREAIRPAVNNPIRAGMLLEGGLRSSERGSSFLELVVSYRALPRLPEGPWPGNGQSAQIAAGPTSIDANFSHFTIGLGGGLRF